MGEINILYMSCLSLALSFSMLCITAVALFLFTLVFTAVFSCAKYSSPASYSLKDVCSGIFRNNNPHSSSTIKLLNSVQKENDSTRSCIIVFSSI